MTTPSDLLDAASADIEAGYLQRGALLAYQAATKAAKATAHRLGFPADVENDLIDLMSVLDGISPMPDDLYDAASVSAWINQNARTSARYSSGFGVALAFRQHAETPREQQRTTPELFWQDYQYAWYLQSITKFIKNISHAELPEDGHGSPKPRD